MKGDWERVSRSSPCSICGGPDNCSIAKDGSAALCGRESKGSISTNAGGQHLHPLEDRKAKGDWWAHPSHERDRRQAEQRDAEQLESVDYAKMVKAGPDAKPHVEQLAEELFVSAHELESIGVGYADIGGECYTVPERDPRGKIVGINRRFADGSKKSIGSRGLTYVENFDHYSGPILIPEGGSDTAAAMTMGMAAVGRFSNSGGAEMVAELMQVRNIPTDRPIIVLGEDDRLKNGQPRRSHSEHGDRCECGECFPGKFGALTVAKRMTEILGRSVKCAMPPDGSKDVRAWLIAQGDADPLELGPRFVAGLKTINPTGLPEIISLERLVAENPTLSPPVIEGYARRSEVINLIAKSKVGKSWFGYGMALCVAAGWEWLGQFRTTRGRVLIIDNELPKAVLAHRIPRVQAAMGIEDEFIRGQIDLISLRGNLLGIMEIERMFGRMEQNYYSLIIIDALYRMMPPGMSENDNAAMAQVYNQVDRYAAMSGAAIVLVHHATKGGQSDKDVTDIGAGAGSQSRAADTHLVLRPHKEEDCAVLEAAVRSWAPVPATAVRWEFPLWVPDGNLDPEALKGRKEPLDDRKEAADTEAHGIILADLQTKGPGTIKKLIERTGISRQRLERLIGQLNSAGKVLSKTVKVRGNECEEYSYAVSA